MKKNLIFPLVAGAVLVASSIVGGATVASQNAALDAQKANLTSLTNKAAAARAATGKLEQSSSLDAFGANESRVAADTRIVKDLAQRALTWNSDASYREARASTMRVYGLSEDSAFMKSFLPKAPVNIDKQGNEYPYIDAAGLNSQVGDTTVKLLSVDGVNYSYLGLVDVQSKSSDGLGAAVNVATMLLTIDGDGKVTKLTGFASTTQPRTSG